MRAREFVINVPITIKINGDGDPEVSNSNEDQPEYNNDGSAKQNAFVPPLQQKIELMRQAGGKESHIIDQLTADEDEPLGP